MKTLVPKKKKKQSKHKDQTTMEKEEENNMFQFNVTKKLKTIKIILK